MRKPISARILSADPLDPSASLGRKTLTVDKLLAPVPDQTYTTSIRGLGANFPPPTPEHPSAKAFKAPSTPVVFLKPATTIAHPQDPITIPQAARNTKVDLEVELAVVIKKSCKNVSRTEAKDYILGYTISNDVSSRGLCAQGVQWGLGKSFDSWCPLGPCLISPNFLKNWKGIDMVAKVNGEVIIKGRTEQLIFGVEELVEILSSGATLEAGTVILTGTPMPLYRAANETGPWLSHGDECVLTLAGGFGKFLHWSWN